MNLAAAGSKAGSSTYREILQQPELWPTTVHRIFAARRQFGLDRHLAGQRVLFTGAGTSAYAAAAAAAAAPRAMAVPTTDLLVDAERHLADIDAVVTLARSG